MPTTKPGDTGSLMIDPTVKHSLGEDAVPSTGHSKEGVPSDVRTINGWGVDLDPANRGVFPKELKSNVKTARGEVRYWQEARSVIDVSNEQPGLTPVFGDTIPPRGLSGILRNYAYEFGEGANRHWLTLMLADRVDQVESLFSDAFRGRPDNIVEEKGWAANFKYEETRRNIAQPLLAGLGFVVAVAAGVAVARAMRDRE